MIDHYYAVIMAGGGGTRLWPLSRKKRPKQALSLEGQQSLFQATLQRIEGIFPPQRIFIVTTETQAEQLQAQSPHIPLDNYLLEPLPRGTASVVGLAAVELQHRDPQAVMAILTADHYIGNVPLFHQLLQSSHQAACEGYLVTLGITPTYPSTGYGYIQNGEPVGVFSGLEVYKVLRFKEKPELPQAKAMMALGGHAWNSGMFVWQVSDIMAEFTRQMPDFAAQLETLASAWGTPNQAVTLQQVWPQVRVQTIDFGIMEGAKNVVVIPAADLAWNDVGSWESLFEVLPGDALGNIFRANKHIEVETNNSLIFAQEGNRLMVSIGVENLVIVDTGDVVMVCHRDYAQKVRQVVNQLKQYYPDYE